MNKENIIGKERIKELYKALSRSFFMNTFYWREQIEYRHESAKEIRQLIANGFLDKPKDKSYKVEIENYLKEKGL